MSENIDTVHRYLDGFRAAAQEPGALICERHFMKQYTIWRIGAALLALGCTHVVKVPTDCGPGPQPVGRSAIGWERIAGASRVSGRVASPSLSPLEAATVGLARLSVSPSRERLTTSNRLGEFSFDS